MKIIIWLKVYAFAVFWLISQNINLIGNVYAYNAGTMVYLHIFFFLLSTIKKHLETCSQPRSNLQIKAYTSFFLQIVLRCFWKCTICRKRFRQGLCTVNDPLCLREINFLKKSLCIICTSPFNWFARSSSLFSMFIQNRKRINHIPSSLSTCTSFRMNVGMLNILQHLTWKRGPVPLRDLQVF